jgi:lipopolysaccharide transport system permease protein
MGDNAFQYRTMITSQHKLLDLHIGETFRYRDLIYLFVKRDFTAMYKQTILGPLWAVIQPLLTTVVFTIIFGRLARLTTADAPGDLMIPGFLFYMAGNICWGYFAATVNDISNVFIKNRNIMGKVYFPRLVGPIASACSKLISFGIQFVLMLGILLIYILTGDTVVRITPMLLLIPLLVLHLMVLAIGCGIIISSVTTKYRDLAMLVSFGLQLWQYGSPVAYGLELVPLRYRGLYLLNPVTPILTAFRYALFGAGFFSLKYYAISLIVTGVVFLVGLILFSRIERTFMDTI